MTGKVTWVRKGGGREKRHFKKKLGKNKVFKEKGKERANFRKET